MGPLGIIAGLGDLPVNIAADAVSSGRGVYVLSLDGFVEPKLADYPGEVIGIGQLARQVKLLKQAGCREIVFAGIVKRPDFSKLKLDLQGVSLLPKVLKAARNGDDALLRVLVGHFEKNGFSVVAAEEASATLLAPEGLIAGPEPDEAQLADLRKGAGVASGIGRLDIGQGCVVCDGLVLSVEAQEGTDEMLRRTIRLDEAIRGTAAAPRGVLVKRPKPIQERRIDLPTCGVATVEAAAGAFLSGIGVEAGGALLIERDRMVARANDLGLFIYGFPKDWD